MTRLPHGSLLTAVAVAAVMTTSACQKSASKPPRVPTPVTLASVRLAAVPYTVVANGTVMPMQTAAVSSQVDGIIKEVTFHEGQDVEQGQVLFRIEPRPYQAAYDQAVANLTRDKASAAYAAAEVVRYDSLVTKDYVTKEQADQQRATAASAQATVVADSAQVVNAKFNLDNTVVRAPIGGRTGALLVRTGNLVHGAAGTPLVVINQIHPILVQFSVPATNLPDIQKHEVGGKLPVTVYQAIAMNAASTQGDTSSDAAQGASVVPGSGTAGADPANITLSGPGTAGTLSFINNAVDTTTGTVLLKGTFDNTKNDLWPGEYVATVLQLYVQQNAVVVPAPAIMTGQQGTYVFVVDSTSTAHQRPVSVSRETDSLAVVSSGLKPGEHVVTDGQSRIQNGAKVATHTPNGANGAGGGTNSTTHAGAAGHGQSKGQHRPQG